MESFDGKVAFVTGAASGIGLEISRALAKRGVKVMLADIDENGLQEAAQRLHNEGAEVGTVKCDVSNVDDVRRAADATIAQFEKVHIVANNAGVALRGVPGETPIEDWRWIVDINLMGVVHGVEIFTPLIASHGEGGHFVNTASMAGHIATAGMGPYAATKFAVVGYSESMKQDLEPQGIGVSVLCPGWVNTHIHETERNRPSGKQEDEEAAATLAQIIENGIDPETVGDYVADCIAADRFYIFTHPEMEQVINFRHSLISADYAVSSADERFVTDRELVLNVALPTSTGTNSG
ncbi:MAG: SDR family NAD(P)-dependent oxidoreductase [Proteobacteria bacterium]|nr:SDR family NAD(P)-dependent oxidoreductase [Pseudomonadota bacterium]